MDRRLIGLAVVVAVLVLMPFAAAA